MRKFYSFLIAVLAVCGMANAQTTLTWVAVDQSYANAQDFDGQTIQLNETISATFSKGTGSTTPKYYDTGTAMRLYAGNTMVISGSNILKVVLTYSGASNAGEVSTSPEGYELDGVVGTWQGSSESVTFTRGGTSGHVRIQKIEVTYGSVDPNFVAAPTIKPATGTYYEAQEVTIKAGEGSSIFYTLDGSEPTASSTAYTAPFTVETTTTVKAIAVKGENKSQVSESVITIETVQKKTIAEIIATGA